MNSKYSSPLWKSTRCLALGIAVGMLAGYAAKATPYATCLTNDGGIVSFRLNEAADGVKILWNGGATVTNLGPRAKGLTVTNLGVTGTFFVQVVKAGNSAFGTNSPVPFNSPRAVALNVNPKSANFGRVFVGNSAAGAQGDGVYVLQSDFTDIFGGVRTGGIDFVKGGASSPWRLTVGEDDDLLYITDWSDAAGNLYVADQDLNSFNYALQPLGPCLDGTVNAATDTGNPVGYGNNHGSVASVVVFGSTAQSNLTIITVDEDLQDDRADTTANQMNSVWRYDVGTNAFPYTDFFTNRLLTPQIQFVSNVEGLSHGTNGYLYFCQGRSAGNEPGVWAVTNIYTASKYAWNDPNVWNSKTASLQAGSSTDILRTTVSVSASRDGRWLALINNENNVVTVVRLTNGIPDLARVVRYTGFGTTLSGRDIAWDAADNIYIASSGLAMVNSLSLGLSATNTTGSDGTFVSAQPSVVSVVATTNLAHRTDVTGNFTFYRDGDTSAPLTVNYTVSGAATNGVDYTTIPTSITFAAGAASTNLAIVPLPSTKPMPPVAATITLSVNAAYNLVDGRSATVVIADNQIPQLSVTPNFTNMYERLQADFIRFTITRLGETNSTVSATITNGGTAVLFSDYTGPNSFTMMPGENRTTLDFNPVANSVVEGPLSVILGIAPPLGGEYTLTNSVATFTVIDSDLATETVLWSDDFDSYSGTLATNTLPAAWTASFASLSNLNDFSFTFGYDYNADGIPAAPGTATTYGLKATVNKWDTRAAAAALNFYPAGKSFSGNFALRFNMLLVNGAVNGTEHGIFGVNHSGTKTNWNRSGGVGNAYATNQDGLWFSVNAVGGNSWDYALFTAASGTATSPQVISNRQSAATTQVFKNNGLLTGPYAAGGAPGCAWNGAKNWVDVEVAQTPGLVVLKLDNQVIVAATNVTAFNSGNVMLGYNDMFDSIGDYTNAAVYYDNVRVVRIAAPTIVTQPSNVVAAVGTPANLQVEASTSTGITNYQWFFKNAPVAGATGPALSVGSVQATNYGTYFVVVDDGTYQAASAAATITPPAPVINVPPASRVAVVGSSPSFTVVATTFSGTTNYQWMYYGTNLAGATGATFTRTNVQSPSFGGPYTVRVNDGFTSVTSAPPATLTLAVSPAIASPAHTGADFSFNFQTEVGPDYVVDYKASLSAPAWTALSTNAGTGGILSVTNAATTPEGYYRIRLQ